MYLDWWFNWREFRALPFPGDIYDQPMYVYETLWLCARVAADEQKPITPEVPGG